ncbi:MAG: RDD family protein [Chlamydiia bacterium]|nr:RDD family protein [Chlamydiia bacterium]
MDKAVWFYMSGEGKEGPVSHHELQEMLDRGEIDLQTKVWTESLNAWLPISEVEHFNMSTLDDTPTIEIEKKVSYARETDPDYVRGRPWVRFWARMIDYSLFALILGFIVGYFRINVGFIEPIFGMTLIFVWVFVETCLIATWGTTPGKWLLRTYVRDRNHRRLSFSEALNRSFSVWWIGMGAGIPIISLITMIVAAVKLSNTGITSWDRRSEYRIFHNKVGVTRTLVVILYFLCYFWLISWGQMQLMYAQ